MKAKEIEVGRKYVAKVAGKLTTVRVDSITEGGSVASWATGTRRPPRRTLYYDVTNLRTGRHTMFHSPQKFRAAYNKQSELHAE